MPRVHSHYENLRVARNAPPEVIRAAYRALSQRYHPDLNPGDAEAARIMALLNVAYETLSDPVSRAEHDAWLKQQDAVEPNETPRTYQTRRSPRSEFHEGDEPNEPQPAKPAVPAWETRLPFDVVAVIKHLHRRWGWYVTVTIALFVFYGNQTPSPARQVPAAPVAAYQPPVLPARPTYTAPQTAPNGSAWPSTAAYIQGYPRLNSGGNGEITVDNTQSDDDVFVKVLSLSGTRPKAVRQIFIPGGQTFTTKRVRPGKYDVRYQSLASGVILKTESFDLTEVETSEGTRYKSMRMTLYKVRDGNMQTTSISEDEFE
jgi:hypothetical protein